MPATIEGACAAPSRACVHAGRNRAWRRVPEGVSPTENDRRRPGWRGGHPCRPRHAEAAHPHRREGDRGAHARAARRQSGHRRGARRHERECDPRARPSARRRAVHEARRHHPRRRDAERQHESRSRRPPRGWQGALPRRGPTVPRRPHHRRLHRGARRVRRGRYGDPLRRHHHRGRRGLGHRRHPEAGGAPSGPDPAVSASRSSAAPTSSLPTTPPSLQPTTAASCSPTSPRSASRWSKARQRT